MNPFLQVSEDNVEGNLMFDDDELFNAGAFSAAIPQHSPISNRIASGSPFAAAEETVPMLRQEYVDEFVRSKENFAVHLLRSTMTKLFLNWKGIVRLNMSSALNR